MGKSKEQFLDHQRREMEMDRDRAEQEAKLREEEARYYFTKNKTKCIDENK